MAYANLVGITCADKNELFCRIRDFICKRSGTYDYSSAGIGWTLYDSSYATDEDNLAINDWFVIKSVGETGKDSLYFRLKWTSGYISINGFQSWDSFTHAGGNQYGTSNNSMTVAETGTPTLFIYGDLDEIHTINKLSASDYRAGSFGKGAPIWEDQSEEIATCSGILLAGADVLIELDYVPSYWVPGREVYVRTTHENNTYTTEIEKTTITSISGSNITVDLINSYIAGTTRVSDFVGYHVSSSYNWSSTVSTLIGENGLVAQSAVWIYNANFLEASFDPGHYENRWYLLDWFLCSAVAGMVCKSRHTKRVPEFNVGLEAEDVLESWDGSQWRVFKVYPSNYSGIREV